MRVRYACCLKILEYEPREQSNWHPERVHDVLAVCNAREGRESDYGSRGRAFSDISYASCYA